MKRLKKAVVCLVLALSMIGSSVAVAHASWLEVGSFILSAIGILNSGGSSESLAEARYVLRTSWGNSGSSSGALVKVNADVLSDLVIQFSENGVPCKIVYSSNIGGTGVSGYWIECIAEPYKITDVEVRLDGSFTYTGRHFGRQINYSGTYVNAYVYSSEYSTSSVLAAINSTLATANGYLSSAVSRLTTLVSQTDQIEGYIDGVEDLLFALQDKISSSNTWLSMVYQSVDGVEGYIDQIEGRMIKTVSGSTYTISDLAYNAWQRLNSIDGHVDQLEGYLDGVEGYIDGLESSVNTTNSRLDTANGYLAQLDTVVDLLSENHYMCSYLTDSNGADFPTYSLPYQSVTALVARLNAVMPGRQVYLLRRDGTGVNTNTEYFFRRASLTSSGYISVVCLRMSNNSQREFTFYLCDEGNNLYVAGQEYAASIYSRLSDVISAINSMSVDVDMSGVQVTLDDSNLNFWNNNAYCCGYLTDANGNSYSTIPIPYDTAINMIARFNTDYVGQSISALSRSGTASTRYLRSASLLSSGYISISLTNGYNYYLCDSVNNVYYVDPNSNYGGSIRTAVNSIGSQLSALDTGVSRLDSILSLLQERLQSDDGDHEHTYVRSVDQEPTCTVPGLALYTCSVCGAGYSELLDALGHDWSFTEHVAAEYDEDDVEIAEAYDLYTCTRCGKMERSYDENAPASGDNGTIGDLITSIFAKLGQFLGDLLTGLLNLLDKLLTGFDDIVTDFNDKAQAVVELGGDYPEWLSGVWDQVPSDLQLVLSFCLVVTLVGVIGKKLVFTS